MHIVTATDADFVELTAVLLASLRDNGGSEVESVTVFGDRLSSEHKRVLAESYAPGLVAFHDLDAAALQRLGNLATSKHLSVASYARLLAPDLLPHASGRLLHIDCDTIVNRGLAELDVVDLNNHPVAAYSHGKSKRQKWFESLGLPGDTAYLNAGVLLIDLAKWKAENLGQRCLDMLAKHPGHMHLMDQDVLNATLAGDFLVLDRKWNFYESSTSGRYHESAEAFSQAHIIHFVGPTKPSFENSRHPAQALYLKYRDQTPYANKPLVKPLAQRRRAFRMWAHSFMSSMRRITHRNG